MKSVNLISLPAVPSSVLYRSGLVCLATVLIGHCIACLFCFFSVVVPGLDGLRIIKFVFCIDKI